MLLALLNRELRLDSLAKKVCLSFSVLFSFRRILTPRVGEARFPSLVVKRSFYIWARGGAVCHGVEAR